MARKYDWGDGKGRAHSKPSPYTTRTLTRPRAGSYDPALDSQERQAERGLADLLQDTERQSGYELSDFTRGSDDVARERAESGQDFATARQGVERGYGRNLADMLTQRQYNAEDFTRNVGQLDRNYTRLGGQQAQARRQRNVMGGATQQAARKRAENQAWERAPIDTANARFNRASALQESRLGEDRQLSLSDLMTRESRANAGYDRQGGALGLGYQRGDEGRGTTLSRAQRELSSYTQDLNKQRIYESGEALPTVRVRKPRKRR